MVGLGDSPDEERGRALGAPYERAPQLMGAIPGPNWCSPAIFFPLNRIFLPVRLCLYCAKPPRVAVFGGLACPNLLH